MAKKMIAFESVQVVNAFKKKFPNPGKALDELREIRPELAGLIKASGLKRNIIAKAVGLQEPRLFARMGDPESWSDDEIRRLLDFFGLL